MAASTVQNPDVHSESKSAKKKKAKAEAAAAASAASSPAVPESSNTDTPESAANSDGTFESPYLKELYKSVATPSGSSDTSTISSGLCLPIFSHLLTVLRRSIRNVNKKIVSWQPR